MSEHQRKEQAAALAAAAAASVPGRVTRPDDLRPPMRPDPRSESMKRADARIAELRAIPVSGIPADIMKLEKDMAPEGWTYQGKRVSVYNQPDKQSQIGSAAAGWTPVPPDRHPETYIPPDIMLMEKPKQLVDEAHKNRERDTRAEMKSQRRLLTEAPIDSMPGVPGDRRAAKFTEDYMAVRPSGVMDE